MPRRHCVASSRHLLSQAALCRDMLEELMDDEDEVRDMNLSSRPSREERRRVREREKIERGMERWVPLGLLHPH